jgi:hypothetical protein
MSLEDDKERQDREWAEIVANDVFEFLAKESQKRDDFSFTASYVKNDTTATIKQQHESLIKLALDILLEKGRIVLPEDGARARNPKYIVNKSAAAEMFPPTPEDEDDEDDDEEEVGEEDDGEGENAAASNIPKPKKRKPKSAVGKQPKAPRAQPQPEPEPEVVVHVSPPRIPMPQMQATSNVDRGVLDAVIAALQATGEESTPKATIIALVAARGISAEDADKALDFLQEDNKVMLVDDEIYLM